MIKTIPVSLVREGMYVNSLNCGWLEHPFYRSQFLIKGQDQIDKILALDLDSIEIDTDSGRDVDSPVVIAQRMPPAASCLADVAPSVSVGQEMSRARGVHKAAHGIMRNVLQSARLGEVPELGQIEETLEGMSASLARNPGALLSLCRIRNADEYTFLHSVSVGALMTAFCAHLKMDVDAVRQAGLGGMLHDIGKTRTPLSILNKRGKLTPMEFDVMRRHPEEGHAILCEVQGIHQVQLDIALQHHERLNGFGYPRGLSEAQIDRMAKIAAIVDVYDALTAERCYHRAMLPSEALSKLLSWSDTEYDHELVCEFIQFVGVYPVGTTVLLESGRIAIIVERNVADSLKPIVLAVYDSRKNRPLDAQRIDLASPAGSSDRIVSAVNSDKYSIDPLHYL